MSGSAALLLIGAGVGGYALYRYLKAHEHEHGGHEHLHPAHAAHAAHAAHGVDPYGLGFTGFGDADPYGLSFTGATSSVDYLDPADARRDARPDRMYYAMPYQILNIGPGVRPMEIDAVGQPTGRKLVLPGEALMAGAIRVGADSVAYDPYDYSGVDAILTGRGGGGFHHQPPPQQQQPQQQQDPSQDPSQGPSMQQPPQSQIPAYQHQHRGRR